MKESVYFLQSGKGGPIKIGKSEDAPARAKHLQTGNPVRLILLATVPGGLLVESSFHHRFAAHRLEGEWFKPGVDLLAFIDGIVWGNKGGTVSAAAMESAKLDEEMFLRELEHEIDAETEEDEAELSAESDEQKTERLRHGEATIAEHWLSKYHEKYAALSQDEQLDLPGHPADPGWLAAVTELVGLAPPPLAVQARKDALRRAIDLFRAVGRHVPKAERERRAADAGTAAANDQAPAEASAGEPDASEAA